MVARDEVLRFCDELLEPGSFQDIALNGLQIEGTDEVNRVTAAVSCNQHSIEAAIDQKADALLVHHGLVLDGKVGRIHGATRARLRGLLANDINLIAYHLPLDGHPEIGNNACLIQSLGLRQVEPLAVFGPVPIGYIATTEHQLTISDFARQVGELSGHKPTILPGGPESVSRIAVLSGSGYPALEEAASKRCDVLLTGDVREPTMAMARELGITVIAAGHEATERLGVQRLAECLAKEFEITYQYVHDPNPV